MSKTKQSKVWLIFVHVFVNVCCTVTLTIKVDNRFYVYHNGGVVLSGDGVLSTHTLNLVDACVLAIKATNFVADAGILVSTSSGVVTDASWKCSSAAEQTGWQLPGFDDAAWSQATVVAPNDGSVWPSVAAGFNPAAQWIWTQDVSNDNVIYCRKTLC